MRSYNQYCAMAKTLDVIGDRWTLLIVRELLLRGPSRYTDLRDGLPGIATNLLGDRLRELEQRGLVNRTAAPPPVASTLYSLTSRGEELRPLMIELVRWGRPMMVEQGDGDDFRAHWLSPAAEALLADVAPDEPPVTLELRAGEQTLQLQAAAGVVRTPAEPAEHPDAVLSGSPQVIVRALFGGLDLAKARAEGLDFDGDPGVLERVRPADGFSPG
jgi:DNA-binding HxlR family transcriptional regulator